jgi:arsenite methyltransferase
MNRYISVIAVIVIGQFLSATSPAGAASKSEGITSHSAYPSAYEEDPRRLEWQKTGKVLDHLLIKQGDVIADIGAGTGFFSLPFAQRVGKNGMVYAVDIDENMVKYLEQRAKKEGLDNIRSVHALPNDPLLPKSSLDLIFICDTYMFIENREEYLIRVRDSLKNGGRLAIVSFNRKATIPAAPPPIKMISRERTIQEAEKAGFALEAVYFFLPYQDFMVFVKR